MEGYRLSPQQARLYLRQDHSSPLASAQCVMRLEGELLPSALSEALRRSVARHVIFRTRFLRPPGVKLPLQVISDTATFGWLVLDPTDIQAAVSHDGHPPDGDSLTRALLEHERARERTRDLASDPVLRASLWQVSDKLHLLALTLPALCADTQTFHNLAAEIAEGYGACVRGESFDEASAAGEAVQYLQFSEWQNEVLADEDAAVGKEYWRQQELGGAATQVLPFAASSDERVARGRVRVALDPAVSTLSEALGYEEEEVLLSCWQVLVRRLAGGEATITAVHDGRKYDELRPAMGLFARTLPLRIDWPEGTKLPALAAAVSAQAREAAEWQEYFAWDEVVGAGGMGAGRGVGFEYERRGKGVEESGVRFEIAEMEVEGEGEGVRARCVRGGEGHLWCEIEYAEG
ncbi:MAG: condensation domain-containing protein, partial [Acidobacteria bacterium]|nr:condensation domain-containing protein [Acidobacteriota bacterium]